MSAFVVAALIMLCGVAFGVILTWFYMKGRVEFWQERFTMERRLKENLLAQNIEISGNHLRIINDLSGLIQGKK